MLFRSSDAFKDRLEGSFGEATQLGHAAVTTCPDRPYLIWKFDYEETPKLNVNYLHQPHDNPSTFFKACTRLHAVYSAFLNEQTSIQAADGHLPFTADVAKEIKEIIVYEGKKDERSEKWREKLNNRVFLNENTSSEDMNLQYNSKGWTVRAMLDNSLASSTDAFQFNIAASKYLNKVHDSILPEMGILSV